MFNTNSKKTIRYNSLLIGITLLSALIFLWPSYRHYKQIKQCYLDQKQTHDQLQNKYIQIKPNQTIPENLISKLTTPQTLTIQKINTPTALCIQTEVTSCTQYLQAISQILLQLTAPLISLTLTRLETGYAIEFEWKKPQ